MHLDDELTQRYLHGELAGPDRSAIDRHVVDCPRCARQLGESRLEEEEVGRLLSLLDSPTPDVTASVVMVRARRTPTFWRWAASLALLLAGAGAAWAAPGSPLPGWVDAVRTRLAPPAHSTSAEQAVPIAGASGVALPGGLPLVIDFPTRPVGLRISVRLGGGPDIRVDAPTGKASFTSDEGRLQVDALEEAEVHVEIPESATSVAIQVTGTTLFAKRGDQITTAAVPGPDGVWVVASPGLP